MNAPEAGMRNNNQIHFDNSVRTLTESLHNFQMDANTADWPDVDSNRTALRDCLINIRTTVADSLKFLQNDANTPIFDFVNSSVSRVELELQSQTDELKAAVSSKTNASCLTKIGITETSLNTKYKSYKSNITTCVNSVKSVTNTDIINRFNPAHFPALSLLNSIGTALGAASTRELFSTFVSCTMRFN